MTPVLPGSLHPSKIKLQWDISHVAHLWKKYALIFLAPGLCPIKSLSTYLSLPIFSQSRQKQSPYLIKNRIPSQKLSLTLSRAILILHYKSISIKVVILKPRFSNKSVLTCRLKRPGQQALDHKQMYLLNDSTRPLSICCPCTVRETKPSGMRIYSR